MVPVLQLFGDKAFPVLTGQGEIVTHVVDVYFSVLPVIKQSFYEVLCDHCLAKPHLVSQQEIIAAPVFAKQVLVYGVCRVFLEVFFQRIVFHCIISAYISNRSLKAMISWYRLPLSGSISPFPVFSAKT